MERAQPGDVRLELAQTLGPDRSSPGTPLATPAPVELLEPRELVSSTATTTLPQRWYGISALVAVGDQRSRALRRRAAP